MHVTPTSVRISHIAQQIFKGGTQALPKAFPACDRPPEPKLALLPELGALVSERGGISCS